MSIITSGTSATGITVLPTYGISGTAAASDYDVTPYQRGPFDPMVAARRSSIEHQINELLTYPEGWDSYSARPLDRRAAATGTNLLLALADLGTPQPHVAPAQNGGMFIEWRTPGREFTLKIAPAGDSVVGYFWNAATGEEWEETWTASGRITPTILRL